MKHLKLFVVSHQKSEFGVEWMRFEADAAVPDLVRRVAQVAFEVTDLSSELAGRKILIPRNGPSDGVRVAFIVENGAPIELLEFTEPAGWRRHRFVMSAVLVRIHAKRRHVCATHREFTDPKHPARLANQWTSNAARKLRRWT